MLNDDSDELFSLICDFCGLSFENTQKKTEHIRSSHSSSNIVSNLLESDSDEELFGCVLTQVEFNAQNGLDDDLDEELGNVLDKVEANARENLKEVSAGAQNIPKNFIPVIECGNTSVLTENIPLSPNRSTDSIETRNPYSPYSEPDDIPTQILPESPVKTSSPNKMHTIVLDDNFFCPKCFRTFEFQANFDFHTSYCKLDTDLVEGGKSTASSTAGFSGYQNLLKPVCDLGECCYIRRAEHLEKFSHPHLEFLLEKIPNIIEGLPRNYVPKVSRQTTLEQLEVLKSLKNKVVIIDEDRPVLSNQELDEMLKKYNENGICSYGEKCFRRNPHHFMCYRHPHIENLILEHGDNIPDFARKGLSLDLFKEQIAFVKKFMNSDSSKKSEVKDAGPTASSSKPPNVSAERHMKNLQAEENCRVVILDRTKQKVADKLKITAPYNIFLTTVSSSSETHTDMHSICFPELLDNALGDLESSLQVNFMVEIGWLLAQYQVMGHRGKPLTLIYGDIDVEIDGKFKHVTSSKVKPPSPFGSHHTKMMVFSYTDKSVRVVVSTANLVESDWDNRTQGLWISQRCPVMEEGSNTMSGDSSTNFKRDLLRYLKNYNLPTLTPWINKISICDMSRISVFFIASVPGTHTADSHLWGQKSLRRVLNENVRVSDNSFPVILQSSSIGSLGPKPESWLLGDIMTTFTSGKKDGISNPPRISFVYPSFNNIVSSYDGLFGGGCLPYSQKTQDKQPWLNNYLCQWKSDKKHRTRAPPHIKSYCRVSPDHTKLSYFLLTSANLSKAAWGNISKAGTLNILSYEAGVLFLPQIFFSTDYFPLTDENNDLELPLFPLPYDLPLTPYETNDTPWVIDHII